MEHEFGAVYSRHLARDLVPGDFGEMTAQQALDAGIEVRSVWLAICRVQDVPVERQLGPDWKPRG